MLIFAVSVWFSSAPQHLLTMLEQLQHKKYLVILWNLFAELDFCTSELFIRFQFSLYLGMCVLLIWLCILIIALQVQCVPNCIYYFGGIDPCVLYYLCTFTNQNLYFSIVFFFYMLLSKPFLICFKNFRDGEGKKLVAGSNFPLKFRFTEKQQHAPI